MIDCQQAMMNGERAGAEFFVATLDVAGIDEAATGVEAGLGNRGRDYTACTVFRVIVQCPESRVQSRGGEQAIANSPFSIVNGPVFEAVDVFVDQGSGHFREGRQV